LSYYELSFEIMNISLETNSIFGIDFLIYPTKHISVEGMSGMGKSTTLVHLLIEHIRDGNGGPSYLSSRGHR